MSEAIIKNEGSEELVNSNDQIDNLSFLSWLSDEETIRDEGTIAGKINAKPEPVIHLIDKYHEWQYLQFYRKSGLFSVEESEKILLRLAQLKDDIYTLKEENFILTRDFPINNGVYLKFFGLSILNFFSAGLLFYLFFLLLKPADLIVIKWIVIYSLIIIPLLWFIIGFSFPKGFVALKSSFYYWVEKSRIKEKMKNNNFAIELKQKDIAFIESKYNFLPTRNEWDEIKALRKDLFLSEFNLSNSFYTNKK
jgi:hypothetical protein